MIDPKSLRLAAYQGDVADVLNERSQRVGRVQRKLEPSQYYLASFLLVEHGHSMLMRIPATTFATEADALAAIAARLEKGVLGPPGTR